MYDEVFLDFALMDEHVDEINKIRGLIRGLFTTGGLRRSHE